MWIIHSLLSWSLALNLALEVIPNIAPAVLFPAVEGEGLEKNDLNMDHMAPAVRPSFVRKYIPMIRTMIAMTASVILPI